MKFLAQIENKNIIIAISLILLLSLSCFIPIAISKTYTAMPDRDTGTIVGVSPTLIGLDQEVIINIMTYPAPSGPTYFAQDMVGGLLGGFSNISVTLTHPDGTKETFMPIDESLAHADLPVPGQQQLWAPAILLQARCNRHLLNYSKFPRQNIHHR